MFFLVYSIVISLWKWQSSGLFSKADSLVAVLTVRLSHIQLLVGAILYFVSSKVMFDKEAMASSVIRFFTVEHITIMLVAIACLTIGNIKAKKVSEDKQKAKLIFLWFLAAVVLILAAIPWPFRGLGSGWF
jgi:hypothetical protein